jgi:uncharacterized protein (TIGR02300 family)
MSKKVAERGNKRTCPSCEARFYDLNRDPMTCPMCQAEVAASSFVSGAETASALAAEKASRRAAAKRPAFVPRAEAVVDAELPEAAEVPDVVLEGEEATAEGEEETFLPDEEDDADVSGFIDGGIEEKGQEEA